jgi:pyrrolidone-carboxylate peptidase
VTTHTGHNKISTKEISNSLNSKDQRNRLFFQPKLTVTAPNDEYEKEADAMADKVMRMQQPFIQPKPLAITSVQRKCAHCEEEEEKTQRKEMNASETTADHSLESYIGNLNGSGQLLPGEVRNFYEPRFGYDFSNVKVHTDSNAAKSAQSINALAYTSGNNIVFNNGQYSPDSDNGKRLLGHELTHIVQQRNNIAPKKMIQRAPKRPPKRKDCKEQPDDYIRLIVVNQELPQMVSIFWNYSNETKTDICSTGKGGCCIPDDADNSVVGCTEAESKRNGSNCTPIGLHTVSSVVRKSRGDVDFWTQFNDARAIAVHKYDYAPNLVTGEPLSHGCVRLNEPMAIEIYCGAIPGITKVEVRGFSRPRCSDENLREQWLGDFRKASSKDGEPGDRKEARSELIDHLKLGKGKKAEAALDKVIEEAGGDKGMTAESIASKIPKCIGVSNLGKETERGRFLPITQIGIDLLNILLALFGVHYPDYINESLLIELRKQMGLARTLTGATTALVQLGSDLWSGSHATASKVNDRQLYWTRLLAIREINEWHPVFGFNSAQRAALVKKFEMASRGLDRVSFAPGAEGSKKILITGFDPFGMDVHDISIGNPSGAVVLALDGKTITNGSCSAQVKGAIFPVRFQDFNEGIVETYLRNFLSGENKADMIMTISQGGSSFELERWAGRTRANIPDNSDQGSDRPALDKSLAKQYGKKGRKDEFIESTLPLNEMAAKNAAVIDSSYSGHTAGGTKVDQSTNTSPPAGTIADEGSGGSFLSNEIFYRARLLELNEGVEIPTGHLHIPIATHSQYPSIIAGVEKILVNSLTALCKQA